jgi:cell division protein FtsZ
MNDFHNRFSFDDDAHEQAKIRVVGVGGGGGNAVNNMLAKGIHGVEFIALNTDSQALTANLAPLKIQLGRERTQGLGAGARPVVGMEAATESHRAIEQALEGCDMVFVTAGMGGGTGTGAAPVVASIARDLGILTVAVVTKPFECEGRKRMKMADKGIDELRSVTDTLVVIPNERLLDVAQDETSLVEAFAMADDVLYNATRGISDLITVHGLVNLDFADVRTTMVDGGTALMGSGVASGERRADRAAQEALSSPLLDGVSIRGARNVLVNITAGPSLGVREATQAVSIIQQEAGDEAEVIFGTVISQDMGEELRVTVIATGFDPDSARQAAPSKSGRVRLTGPIDPSLVDGYKGESSLKQLDEPAYSRRTVVATEEGEAEVVEIEATRVPHIRRVTIPEIQHRKDRILRKDDTDVPAFLRKMMD